MIVWLTHSSFSAYSSIEVWPKKPRLRDYTNGDVMFVDSYGHYEPDYVICLRYFHKLTDFRLKPGECRCVDMRLDIKPVTPKRKKVKRCQARTTHRNR